MQNEFDAIATRAAALRLTVHELVDQVEGVSRVTYWRAETGRIKLNARVRVLRKLEIHLAKLEAERATVSA